MRYFLSAVHLELDLFMLMPAIILLDQETLLDREISISQKKIHTTTKFNVKYHCVDRYANFRDDICS